MKLELNKIYNEDCLGDKELGTGMWRIPDKSIDMICTDLPYETTACKWDSIIPFDKLWEQYERIIKDDGAIVLFGSQPFTSALIMSNPKWFRCEWIWDKVMGGNFVQAKRHPMKVHENIILFSKKPVSYNPQMTVADLTKNRKPSTRTRNSSTVPMASGRIIDSPTKDDTKRYPKSIQTFHAQSAECNNTKRLHPTQKPVKLIEYLLRTYSNENDIILDNCMGSGTTAIATLNIGGGRSYIGFESDEGYYNKAIERIELHKKEIS